jgi:protein regulator of cytokinesis 1
VVKMKRDPSVGGGSGVGVSLQSEYEVMMSRLESIRLVREKATEDIVSSQRRIYEAYAALSGCTIEEVATSSAEMEAWADTSSNLTEEQRELFRSKAVDYEESVSSRTQAIVSLLVDCQNLIRELEIVPPGCDGKDENDTDGYVDVGQNEDDVKIMSSLKSIQRSDTNKDGNSGDGGGGKRPRSRGKSSDSYTVKSLFETPSCVGIGKDVLDRLTSRIAELNGEKRNRRKKLGEMGAAIASLWSLLRIPSEEQRAFTDNISGLGMDTLQKGERELDRLNELKAVMIGKLIREQRQTIEELWERTNATEGEKATFDRYFYIHDEDQLTDELLAKHEEYAGSLNAKLEKMQPILDLIERRESIIEERVELEMLQRDPDRLKGRNASKQLMKEEKMMRRVQKELPKITQHLERKLKEWFDENKPSQTEGEVRDEDLGHFMYKGLPYLRTMKIQEHEWKTRKERGEQERQRKRQEERSNSSGSAFGSSYSKLPGKKSSKWNPPAASNSRPRSASNMRPASRGLRPGDMNRVNRPPAGEKSTKPGATTKSSGYGARAASAPRMRF